MSGRAPDGYPIFTPEEAQAAARTPGNAGKRYYVSGNAQIQRFPDTGRVAAALGATNAPTLTWGPAPSDHSGAAAQPHQQWTFADRMADLLGIGPEDTSRAIAYDPKNDRPGQSTGEDVARSAVTGAERGFTGLLGMGGSARDLAAQLFAGAVSPFTGADKMRDVQQWAQGVVHRNVPVVGDLPDSAPFDAKMQQTTGSYHHPQTSAGRLSERVSSMWPILIGARGTPVQMAAGVAIPGVTSWGASEVAPEPYKDLAGTIGGAVGGVISGRILGDTPPDAQLMADKIPGTGMTEAQRQAVIDSLERGDRVGMRPTTAEAIDANVPGAKTAALQRYAENTQAGIDTLGPRMAERPGQMRTIVGNIADQLAPEGTPPGMLADAARTAATDALEATRRATNAPAEPFYKGLEGEQVPAQTWAQIRDNPTFKVALSELRSDPILGPRFAHLPDNNLSVINEVVQIAHDMKTTFTPAPGNQYGRSTKSAAVGSDAGTVNATMRGLSDNWTQAHDIVAQGRQTQLTPMQQGPLGDIAGRPGMPPGDIDTMANSLFPPKPGEMQPNVTADALAAMDYQNPTLSGRLLRDYLTRQAAENYGNNSNPNTFAPSRFANEVAGNPYQRETLQNAVSQTNPQAGAQFADALSTFETTGRRLPEGSPTAPKLETEAAVKSGGRAANVVVGGGSLRLLLDRATGFMDDLRVRYNQDALARSLAADPARARVLLDQIDAAKGNPPLQRSLLGSLIGANVTAQGNQQ